MINECELIHATTTTMHCRYKTKSALVCHICLDDGQQVREILLVTVSDFCVLPHSSAYVVVIARAGCQLEVSTPKIITGRICCVCLAVCPNKCKRCLTDDSGNSGQCLDQQCESTYGIKNSDRFCYCECSGFLAVSGNSTHCLHQLPPCP